MVDGASLPCKTVKVPMRKYYETKIGIWVDSETDKHLDDHLKGASRSRQRRRQLISALEKSSTGHVELQNMEISVHHIVSTS